MPATAAKTEATHTPGPWRVAPASAYASGGLNIDAGENGQGGYVCLVGRDDPHARADASLIAAAPDMLAELRRLLARHGEQATADIIAKAAA